MATITSTNGQGSGEKTVTETTLDGTDTFTYKAGVNQTLTLRNATGGALTPLIDGDGAGTVEVSGVGAIDISAGYQMGSIGAGEVATIKTETIKKFLVGTIAMTGGTGIVATLLEY